MAAVDTVGVYSSGATGSEPHGSRYEADRTVAVHNRTDRLPIADTGPVASRRTRGTLHTARAVTLRGRRHPSGRRLTAGRRWLGGAARDGGAGGRGCAGGWPTPGTPSSPGN